MENEKPRALRLADWCEENSSGIYRPSAEAAEELRWQYARIAELEAQVKQLQREPLSEQVITRWVDSGEYNVITNDWASHIDFARAIEAAHNIK